MKRTKRKAPRVIGQLAVRAGQTFLARAPRGPRRVQVVSVRLAGGTPRVICRELKRDGTPRHRTAASWTLKMPVLQWVTALTWDGQRWRMPDGYQEAA